MSALLKPAQNLYAELCDLPPHVTGEIINGVLYTQPRPAGPHSLTASALGGELYGGYQRGTGGPGGWWIINEPEIHFIRDIEVCVPDIAGWRKERMPKIPRGHRFEIVPNWVCEVLSPSTGKNDRVVKMPVYAQYGVGYLWLVHPSDRTLEAFALREGCWTVIGLFQDNETIHVAPFEEMALNLGSLWADIEDG